MSDSDDFERISTDSDLEQESKAADGAVGGVVVRKSQKLKDVVNELRAESERLRHENEHLHALCSATQQQLEQAKQQQQQQVNDESELKREFDALSRTNQSVCEQLAALESENKRLNAIISNNHQQQQQQPQTAKTGATVTARLESEKKALYSQLAETNRRFAQVKTHLASVERKRRLEKDAHVQEALKLKEQLSKLTDQLLKLKQQLQHHKSLRTSPPMPQPSPQPATPASSVSGTLLLAELSTKLAKMDEERERAKCRSLVATLRASLLMRFLYSHRTDDTFVRGLFVSRRSRQQFEPENAVVYRVHLAEFVAFCVSPQGKASQHYRYIGERFAEFTHNAMSLEDAVCMQLHDGDDESGCVAMTTTTNTTTIDTYSFDVDEFFRRHMADFVNVKFYQAHIDRMVHILKSNARSVHGDASSNEATVSVAADPFQKEIKSLETLSIADID